MYDRPVVVVGAGVAGLRVAEQLRRSSPATPVVLVGEEAHPPYNRPPLSKAALVGAIDEPPLLRPADGYDDLGVELRLRTRASALDPCRREVTLDDGSTLGYAQLVIATGLAARRPAGLTAVPRVHVLRTWNDVEQLRSDLVADGHVTVVGAGVLGAEAAATLRTAGHEVTLIDTAPHPMSRVVGPLLGTAIAELHRSHGVDLRCGTGLTSAVPADGGLNVTLTDTTVLRTSAILLATGAAPVTGWLESSGLALDDGVLVDEHGRTSAEGVWAVGDVARRPHPSGTGTLRLEHWTNAVESGLQVAANMLAESAQRRGLPLAPYFWSDQFSMKLQAVGLPTPDDELALVDGALGTEGFLAVAHRAGAVTGVLAVNRPGALMRSRASVSAGGALADLLALAPWAPRPRG